MKQEIKDYKCPYCHNHFLMNRGAFSNHMRYCNNNPKSVNNKLILSEKQKIFLQNKRDLEKETEKEYTFNCKECGSEYKIILSDKQYNNHKYSDFCSLSCARKNAAKSISKDFKEAKCIDCGKIIYIKNKASEKTCRCEDCKLIHSEPLKKCIICGKEFRRHNSVCCSKECSEIYNKNRKQYLSEETIQKFREIGKKSAKIQSENRRSKNEIEFCKLCENYFDNVKHNKSIFNGWDADIILPDIKFAVLWNGKVHYKPIFGEANYNRVINRDKIKLKEINNAGYIPYIIKDIGKYNINFVQNKFNEFIEYLKENNYII